MDTYVYELNNSLYFNITNRCSNDCTFCLRNYGPGVGGHNLRLSREPSAEEVIAILENKDLSVYDEAVFCGYGEPTYRLDIILKAAAGLKSKGIKTRLDTNGHGNYINGRDITLALSKVIDKVSISLNSPTEEGYNAFCRPLIPDAYAEMLRFASACAARRLDTQLSVVDILPPEEITACYAIAEKLGVKLRVREFI